MSEPAIAFSFFDPAHALHGTARSGTTMLFEDGHPTALTQGPEVSLEPEAYRARVPERFDLRFTPLAPPAELSGQEVRVCRVEGTVGAVTVRCLGTVVTTDEPPAWAELDSLSALSALFDEGHALLATARRPRGALGHDEELIEGWLLAEDGLVAVEETRVSTVFDASGRQRNVGLELWLPGEDYPHRASGRAVAGTSLELEGLRVNAAVFAWEMEGREGVGAYEVVMREPEVGAG